MTWDIGGSGLPGYQTDLGVCVCSDSMDVIRGLDEDSVDLVVTSPPFSLRRPKSYGEPSADSYVDWLLGFMAEVLPKLRDTGSVVVDLGGGSSPASCPVLRTVCR